MSVLETRRLHALARKEPVDGVAMNAKHSADAHGVQAAVVDQSPNRLGMHAELCRNLADADQALALSAYGRHDSCEALHVYGARAWAGWTISPTAQA